MFEACAPLARRQGRISAARPAILHQVYGASVWVLERAKRVACVLRGTGNADWGCVGRAMLRIYLRRVARR
jgi:hypothetical protein